ncbi:NUDIX hydrolase [Dermacoccaceae bacterium W4C1]
MSSEIVVSAVVFRDDAGRVLTVRKRGTQRFQLPGGKWEPGEDAAQAAAREVGEEIGVSVRPQDLVLLGTYTAAAANEPGRQVRSTVYTHALVSQPLAAGEIEQLRWDDPAEQPASDLAPLLATCVFPALLGA